MHVYVDLTLCDSHGQCTFVSPTVFVLDDDDRLRYDAEPDDALRPQVMEAANVCPKRAIHIEPGE